MAIQTSRPRGPTSSLGNTETRTQATPKVTTSPTRSVANAWRALPGGRRAVNSPRYAIMQAVSDPRAARLKPNRASCGKDGYSACPTTTP